MALWNRILMPISNIWDHGDGNSNGQKDPTSFTAGGGNYNVGDVAFEGVDKSQDSLTQMMRSITNLTGQAGKDFLNTGTKTTQKGMDTIDPALNYWMKLLSGDQQAMTEAVAPEARTIVSQYDTARKAMQTTAPRGGYRSQAMAELPFKKAGDIGTLIQKLRPEAASQVTDIGKFLSTLGISQSGLGMQSLATTIQGLIARRGQNNQENAATMQMLASLGTGIGQLVAMGVSGGGGSGSGGGGK